MADIAKLGFQVDTTDLKEAVGDLYNFSSVSKQAYTATQRMSAAASGATSKAGKSFQILATGELEASENLRNYSNGINQAIKMQNSFAAATNKVTAALKGQTVAQRNMYSTALGSGTVGGSVGRFALGNMPTFSKSTPIERDMRPNRFNTANIAAQFQDIGVTAAMGMNPLTIALQQGTQLSAILNTMRSPLQGLKEAFISIINPISLVSIGLTGLVAAIIQTVDWSKVWKSTASGLSTAVSWLRENVDLVTKSLLTLIGLGIVTHLGAISTAVGALILGLGKILILLAPIVASAAGITLLAIAFYKLGEAIAQSQGFTYLEAMKGVINTLIAMFANGITVIQNSFGLFWNDMKLMAANFLNFFVDIIEKAGIIGGSLGALFDRGEYLSKFIKNFEHYKKAVRETTGVNEDMLENRSKYLLEGVQDLMNPKDYVGQFAINLKEGIGKGLDWVQEKLTGTSEESDKAWDKIIKGAERTYDSLVQEGDLIGRIGYDYEYNKEKLDLLNKAKEEGITLDATRLGQIEEISQRIARQADEVNTLKDRFDFAKSTTSGFFKDLKSALLDGKNAWEAFGDAVTNVLSRILDKITDIGVDMLFAGMKGMGWFGSSSNFTGHAAYEVGPFLPQAVGGAWSHGVQMFATGGVVSSPTLFGTRSGLGVMGEAGPEAVMPLQRGANGELGIRADGVGGANVVVNVINNSNAQASVNQRETNNGTEIDVLIDQVVAEKLGTQGTASNNAMNAWNNRSLIAR